MDTCPLCQDRNVLPQDQCPTCANVQQYYGNKEKISANNVEDRISFPGPGRIEHSPIYGNYVVASRNILKGEVIIVERPLLVSTYGPTDCIPICLSCGKDVAFSAKCSKCKWPICGIECEEAPVHAEHECCIFQKSAVLPKGLLVEYFAIEALRCLMLREKSDWKWKRILSFESHSEERKVKASTKEMLDFITDFIREKCGQKHFDEDVIDHAVGVTFVNTFWTFKDLGSYSSVLFDKVTLFAHDCDPNTYRKLVDLPPGPPSEGDCFTRFPIGIEVKAKREIKEGEMISIRYINIDQGVVERRKELLDLFYFHCSCTRCLIQLLDLDKLNLNGNESENS